MNVPDLKDRAILFGWIGGLLLVGMLLWGLTQPLQTRCLMRAVNKSLEHLKDPRRVSAPLGRHPVSASPPGVWYSVSDSDAAMLVFAVMWDGILVPCGARVSGEGKVEELLPLGSHAEQLLKNIPEAALRFYIHRIETAAAERGGQ
jgi:hypothetical protein